ncbi:MAG: transporter [Haloechinothrix sp.]
MERFGLTMLVLAVFLLAVLGMWRGWRRKAAEQSARYAPFPEVPEHLADPEHGFGAGPRDVATGIYVATTRSGHWQDRIVARGAGIRGPATLRRYTAGVVVDRHGAPSFFIPAESLLDAKTAKGMAGKVMGTEGLLVITWRLGDVAVDTGFRGDDIADYPQWIHALLAMTPDEGHSHPDDEGRPEGGSRRRESQNGLP